MAEENGNITDTGTKQETWNYRERRSNERKKVDLKKTFSAETRTDSIQNCYIYIVDMSSGGMKVMTDLTFPEKMPFIIKLLLEDPLEFHVEQVWRKQVVGYMNAVGLKFVDETPVTQNNARNFIDRFALDLSKRNYRLNKMMTMQTIREDEWINIYAYILNISPQGVEFTSDFEFPAGEAFPIRIFLEPRNPPIEAEARVLFSRDISMERKKGWLEFCNLTEAASLRLREHIDKLIQGELLFKSVAPIENFSLDFDSSTSGLGGDTQARETISLKQIISETEESVNPDDRDWVP